jgi:hypothetical protein
VFIWYIFSGFGILCQEKSGNPGMDVCVCRLQATSSRAEANKNADPSSEEFRKEFFLCVISYPQQLEPGEILTSDADRIFGFTQTIQRQNMKSIDKLC